MATACSKCGLPKVENASVPAQAKLQTMRQSDPSIVAGVGVVPVSLYECGVDTYDLGPFTVRECQCP